MIIVIKPRTPQEKIDALIKQLEDMGFKIGVTQGVELTILGLIGDTSTLNEDSIQTNEIVEKVMHVQEPYKKSNRLFHPESTIIDVEGVKIGPGYFTLMAGPCAVESEEQILSVAHTTKTGGAQFLRGGAFKPRTSPYSFQGLGELGLKHMQTAKAETGLKIVSEIVDINTLDLFLKNVDVIQVGARNMQNFALLRELGKTKKPILLKRGMSATMEELLMSAEYVMSEGNPNVILCERGIRTFEKFTRNTLDISAVPMIRRKSHLPIIVDPSHATGLRWMVEPLAKAAVAVGADGLIIEVHNNPAVALSDGPQSMKPDAFLELTKKIQVLAELEGREFKGMRD